jgi:hypothetical protein
VSLFDIISTHCRLICNETKPHVKQWIMLTNPQLSLIKEKFFEEIGLKFEIELNQMQKSCEKKNVPLLLRDPLSMLLLLLVNLPLDVEKCIFTHLVSNIVVLVFVQSIIDLCRIFDQNERDTWLGHHKYVENKDIKKNNNNQNKVNKKKYHIFNCNKL